MTYNDGINSLNYMGEWMQDQKHGHGRFLYLHSTYEGEWRHGKHDGIGIQTQIVDKTKSNCLQMPVYSATVYEGSWIRGFPHGRLFIYMYQERDDALIFILYYPQL